MSKKKKIFLIHATMGEDLLLYVEADNESDVRDMIDDEAIDGGDMISEKHANPWGGWWDWGAIDEVETGKSVDELNRKLFGNDKLKEELL